MRNVLIYTIYTCVSIHVTITVEEANSRVHHTVLTLFRGCCGAAFCNYGASRSALCSRHMGFLAVWRRGSSPVPYASTRVCGRTSYL